MSERGFITIARGVLDHPLVGAQKPYSEFESWVWMLFEAAYKARRVRVTNGRTVSSVELQRGQFSFSISYLAAAFGWSEKRVRTFLNRLETDGQIQRQTDRQQQVITICNYNHFQISSSQTDRQTTPQSDPQRAGNGQETEESNKVINKKEPLRGASAPTGAPEKELYDFGKRLLGKSAGGLITDLRKMFDYDTTAVMDILRQASEKSSPVEWIAGVLRNTERPKTPQHILFPDEIYRGLQ